MIKILTYIVVFIASNIEKIVNYISGLFLVIVLHTFIPCNGHNDSEKLYQNLNEIQNQST